MGWGRVSVCVHVHVSKEQESRAKFDPVLGCSMHVRNVVNPLYIHAIKTSSNWISILIFVVSSETFMSIHILVIKADYCGRRCINMEEKVLNRVVGQEVCQRKIYFTDMYVIGSYGIVTRQRKMSRRTVSWYNVHSDGAGRYGTIRHCNFLDLC
jgi:hypothetical protein